MAEARTVCALRKSRQSQWRFTGWRPVTMRVLVGSLERSWIGVHGPSGCPWRILARHLGFLKRDRRVSLGESRREANSSMTGPGCPFTSAQHGLGARRRFAEILKKNEQDPGKSAGFLLGFPDPRRGASCLWRVVGTLRIGKGSRYAEIFFEKTTSALGRVRQQRPGPAPLAVEAGPPLSCLTFFFSEYLGGCRRRAPGTRCRSEGA